MFDDITKAQIEHDIYTTEMEARARSVDIGFGGLVHVHEYNGIPVYMPAASHAQYLDYLKPDDQAEVAETQESSPAGRLEALRAIVAEVIGKKMTKFETSGKITKVDEEQRIIYGYASVVTKGGKPVVDRQGDIISPATMEKAATEFMLGARNGLTMHKGEPTTTIVHSMPFTKEIQEAFGIESDLEGWLIAVKVHDDETWERQKAGEFTGFSIGGRATKVELDD